MMRMNKRRVMMKRGLVMTAVMMAEMTAVMTAASAKKS